MVMVVVAASDLSKINVLSAPEGEVGRQVVGGGEVGRQVVGGEGVVKVVEVLVEVLRLDGRWWTCFVLGDWWRRI